MRGPGNKAYNFTAIFVHIWFGFKMQPGLLLLRPQFNPIKGPFIFYEGGGAGGIWEAPFKNRMTPPSAYQFFHMGPPPYSGNFLG